MHCCNLSEEPGRMDSLPSLVGNLSQQCRPVGSRRTLLDLRPDIGDQRRKSAAATEMAMVRADRQIVALDAREERVVSSLERSS